jgi:uncharacterized protein (DUF983 family)
MLLGRCPRCKTGAAFRPGLAGFCGALNDACPNCGLTFLREAGYFLGAMYVSYTLGVVTILLPAVVLTVALDWPVAVVLAIAFVQTAISVPIFMRISRTVWMHVDQRIDPR